jgi:hypothetical protein
MQRVFTSSSRNSKEATAMAIESRIRELDTRHRRLDATIQEEMNRPFADSMKLSELKRQKLKLKEQIAGLKARLN